ncbi:MAG: 50S ribosomal protein L20 [Myxococcota bacterium]|nr:50S ribosomal protein L20 [Myxococcota bacterium]
MRVKRGFKARRRRNRIMKLAKGYYGGRRKMFRRAVDAVHHAWIYAYRHRRERKGDFRRLWIVRINAAARLHALSYSRLIAGLARSNVGLNRKSLADLAVADPSAFGAVAAIARGAAA